MKKNQGIPVLAFLSVCLSVCLGDALAEPIITEVQATSAITTIASEHELKSIQKELQDIGFTIGIHADGLFRDDAGNDYGNADWSLLGTFQGITTEVFFNRKDPLNSKSLPTLLTLRVRSHAGNEEEARSIAQALSEELMAQPSGEQCLGCHADIQLAITNSASVHKPAGDRQCAACHDSHSQARGLLRVPARPYWVHEYATYLATDILCWLCHDKRLSEDAAHSRFSDHNTSLHRVHIADNWKLQGMRGCDSCHDPHGASNLALMKQSVAFGTAGARLNISYQRTGAGGTCKVGCHNEIKSYNTALKRCLANKAL